MYCPTCGNEISVELKYCNRCGANLTLPATSAPVVLAPDPLSSGKTFWDSKLAAFSGRT